MVSPEKRFGNHCPKLKNEKHVNWPLPEAAFSEDVDETSVP
jgi:hypothetical protein